MPPEPNRALRLRWGTYDVRQILGLVLMFAGGALVLPTTAYTFVLGILGSVAHALGWLILPARGGRRFFAALLSLFALWLTLLGIGYSWLIGLALPLWLLVRRRPAVAYLTAPLPLLVGFAAAQAAGPWGPRLVVALLTVGAAVAGAWIAWLGPALFARERRRYQRKSISRP